MRVGAVARLARAAGIVLVLNLLSRVLGFVRDAAIAAQFGAGPATDAYMVAYTIPYFLQTILGMAFLTVMVPTLTAYLVRGEREEGWRVASALGSWTALSLTTLALLGMAAASLLVPVLAPGFPPEVEGLAARLTRIMFLSLPFMGTGMMISGILNAGNYFTSPALAPALSNLIIIATALFFGSRYGIEGLAVGTVVSFVAFLAVQLPDLHRMGFRYTWRLDYHHPIVRKVSLYLLPVIFSLAVNQLYLATNRFFASHLAPGSITALDVGIRLVNLPLGVFVSAVSTAVFPALSEEAARGRREAMAHLTQKGLSLVTLAVVPAAAGLIILREPLVRVVFERGAFGSAATLMTAEVVYYASWGLLAQAAQPILMRSFYALEDVRTPALAGVISVGLNAGFSAVLVRHLGHGGLALSNSLAATFYALTLYYFLKGRLPELNPSFLLRSIGLTLLAAGGMGLATWQGGRWLGLFNPLQGLWELAGRVLAVTAGSAGIFLVLAWFLGVEEVTWVKAMLLKGRRQE
ncbi:murein biosynthesis integral membrane protein MurJ [Thermanaeromonas sp. C210]|uniref:murein biosynthesis integral membrane protein MurJ n=1 Tax=Thermanaeromonas sp. C210 TaxID=2731925 RepID=UPI00155C374D|nr:murein biosynthesis integral membrane protein MurJ [Thermanaeromonas sp. C210]GFN22765.1 putative lipid II flippase MurJ [Thermanaeromonas sp. C210]